MDEINHLYSEFWVYAGSDQMSEPPQLARFNTTEVAPTPHPLSKSETHFSLFGSGPSARDHW